MKKTMLLISFFILASTLFPQSPKIRFDRISMEEGLSQSSVLCIMQDSKGFMWFGTFDGLNKYDGYTFTVYKNDPDDPLSLSNNVIRSICEDKSGTLWIGTQGGGLNKFDREKDCFSNYVHDEKNPSSLSSNAVYSIIEDKSGKLWIGTNDGLNKFDKEKEQFKHFFHNQQDPNSLSNNFAIRLYEDNSGTLWVGTVGGGLNKFNIDTEQFTHFVNNLNDPTSLTSNKVYSIYEDRSKTLWIGTNLGLNKFNKETESFTRFKHNPDDPNSLNNNIIYSINEDNSGFLLVGTYGGGLNRLDKKKKIFTNYQYDSKDPFSISENTLLSLYKDNSGIYWIGTFAAGLNKYNKSLENFGHLKHNPSNENSLSHNLVSAITEDNTGMIWIGSHSGGLNGFDPKSGQFTIYKHDEDDPNSISDNVILSFCNDNSGSIWIGTQSQGLNKFDKSSGRFTQFAHDPNNLNSLSVNSVVALYCDKSDFLWIGTSGGGIDRYDLNNNKFVNYKSNATDSSSLSDNYVYSICEDNSGYLWFGTYFGGLNKFDRKTGKFKHFKFDKKNPNSISSNSISCIYKDKSGVLWIGTYGAGVNKLVKTGTGEEVKFIHYNVKNGLPNNVIGGILEDDDGLIWISTNNGLSRFDPETGKFKNFGFSDGLQGEEFNGGSFFKTKDGKLLFGGVNGFNMFYPDSIKDNNIAPPVMITNFKTFNETVPVATADSDDDRFSIPRHISVSDEIVLSYLEDVFSFEFSALDYSAPEKNQYAYIMEGFNRDWIYTNASARVAPFTNLDAGEYVFRIKGSNKDGVWNEQGASIKITITPPPWKTWWAYTIYFLVVMGFIVGLFFWRTKQLRLRQEELEKEVKERTLQLEEAREIAVEASEKLKRQNLEISARNKYISDSINYAQRIQNSILPSGVYFEKLFPDYFLLFKPKDIVSGDFYWISQVGSKKIVAAIDCTGHGVPGALMSMIGNTLLNEIINFGKVTNPAEILNQLNKRINEELNKDVNQQTYDGMDMALCVIDEESKTLEYSGAYRPLNYFKDGDFFEIKGDRKSIGDIKKEKIKFTSKKIHLNESVIFYLYSDGYVDQHNEQNKKIGSKRFKELLSNIHSSDIEEQKGILLDELKSHEGDEVQRDDITILGIRPILKKKSLDEVLFSFDGEFTHPKIIEISEEVESKLETIFDSKIARTIHFCGNELMQNIGFYSEEKNESGIGSYSIKFNQSQNCITLVSSNLSITDGINNFTNRLDSYNSLNLDELKSLYKEKLKSESHEGSKGAGIGLIQILRKTKNKIKYIIETQNDILSIITLKVKITI